MPFSLPFSFVRHGHYIAQEHLYAVYADPVSNYGARFNVSLRDLSLLTFARG